MGLKREHWRTASPIRAIFREAFEAAGLAYFNPHSLRKTLGTLGERVCQTPEQFKAWSHNLGYEEVMTTLTSYGAVQTLRQWEILRDLAQPAAPPFMPSVDAIAEALALRLGLTSDSRLHGFSADSTHPCDGLALGGLG